MDRPVSMKATSRVEAGLTGNDNFESMLRKFATETRRMLEPGLDCSATGMPLSAGSCLHASVLLASLWNKFHLGGAIVRGGDGALSMGARDAGGRWRSHYWCEFSAQGKCFIVDITADQFGYDPVQMRLHSEASGIDYRAGQQGIVDAVAGELATLLDLDPALLKPAAISLP